MEWYPCGNKDCRHYQEYDLPDGDIKNIIENIMGGYKIPGNLFWCFACERMNKQDLYSVNAGLGQ